MIVPPEEYQSTSGSAISAPDSSNARATNVRFSPEASVIPPGTTSTREIPGAVAKSSGPGSSAVCPPAGTIEIGATPRSSPFSRNRYPTNASPSRMATNRAGPSGVSSVMFIRFPSIRLSVIETIPFGSSGIVR